MTNIKEQELELLEKDLEELGQAQIDELPFPECVRLRRGMYISNLNQMVTEIVDNSVDEHFSGFCDTIATVVIDGVITVQDNGRGIPCTPSPKRPDVTQVELAFTTLHAGGKFGKAGGYGKKTSGMHGVGGSCVQALSENMSIEVTYHGSKYLTEFSKGFITEKTHVTETGLDQSLHGTSVTFKPDYNIWKDSDPLNITALKRRLRQIAYLNPGLTMYMYVDNDNSKFEETFIYVEGIKTYVEELTARKTRISDAISLNQTIDDIDIQVAMAYTDSYSDELYTFCNNMATVDNGDHLTGFIMGLNEAIKEYMAQYKIEFELKSEDIKEGLIGVVSVRVADPIFEGQAKTKLRMTSVRTAVKKATTEMVLDYLDKNPKTAKLILDKIQQASEARRAAQKARQQQRNKKSVKDGTALKLADCSSKDPEKTELFIVEGDSAGGSAKQGRDRNFQAILPVFGKIMNTEKQTFEKVYHNSKLAEFNKAVKVDLGNECKAEDCRYHKIIIMADADVDGAHITCLWITYLYRYMRPLIENGYLYIACPPLYKITKKNGKKVNIVYAYSDEEKDALVEQLGEVGIQRFKGLGEMNSDQLWETTMNPDTRKLIQVSIEDAEECESALLLCMSDDSKMRKEWIMENSIYAEVDV